MKKKDLLTVSKNIEIKGKIQSGSIFSTSGTFDSITIGGLIINTETNLDALSELLTNKDALLDLLKLKI